MLKAPTRLLIPQANIGFKSYTSKGQKIFRGAVGALTAGAISLGVALELSVGADVSEIHPPKFPWSHRGLFDSFDHASMRRGYQVYKQVCAACHSMKFMYFRNLVGAVLTEEEAKADAEEVMVGDGPDEEGKMYERPGKLSDKFPSPYPNDEAAKFANNGALPPDLTFMTGARHGGENYVFSLLTGYCDAPTGVHVPDGMHYNPYFPGGQIAMAQSLFNEVVEFEDGTPASASQMAKDVSTFLRWTQEIEHDDRKRIGLKVLMIAPFIFLVTWYYNRHKWTVMKSRKIIFKPRQH